MIIFYSAGAPFLYSDKTPIERRIKKYFEKLRECMVPHPVVKFHCGILLKETEDYVYTIEGINNEVFLFKRQNLLFQPSKEMTLYQHYKEPENFEETLRTHIYSNWSFPPDAFESIIYESPIQVFYNKGTNYFFQETIGDPFPSFFSSAHFVMKTYEDCGVQIRFNFQKMFVREFVDEVEPIKKKKRS